MRSGRDREAFEWALRGLGVDFSDPDERREHRRSAPEHLKRRWAEEERATRRRRERAESGEYERVPLDEACLGAGPLCVHCHTRLPKAGEGPRRCPGVGRGFPLHRTRRDFRRAARAGFVLMGEAFSVEYETRAVEASVKPWVTVYGPVCSCGYVCIGEGRTRRRARTANWLRRAAHRLRHPLREREPFADWFEREVAP